MVKTIRLILCIPFCFTLLVAWFVWTAFRAAPPLAAENLRGAGLSIAAAIEQLALADASLGSLARYVTPDIAYFALVDRRGLVRFHTNPRLIGHPFAAAYRSDIPDGISEQRERLGTGEEVYLLRTKIHPQNDEYLLVLALHTYRYDRVIRRARAGITVVSALSAAIWGLTLLLILLLRREERHAKEMQRRQELARLGEMGAVLAHEIRSPLAGIKGFAQMVDTAKGLEQAHHYADRIVTQSLRLEALVDNLLAFARDDCGEPETTELSALVADCLALLGPEAGSRRVVMEFEKASPVQAKVVAGRIVQLLLNLMQNALQAMPDGGVLKVALGRRGGFAYLTVSDTGGGIAAEHLPHIFDPFWTNKANGTGLGLALCRKVADQHGASLSVESCVGTGTTCTLTLPLAT